MQVNYCDIIIQFSKSCFEAPQDKLQNDATTSYADDVVIAASSRAVLAGAFKEFIGAATKLGLQDNDVHEYL